MFRGLINDAKTAAGSIVAKQAARATIVVPFLVALGFLTAATALTLADWYGARNAYLMLGGGFAVIGLLAALIVRTKEKEDVIAEEKAAVAETANASVISNTVAAAASAELPLTMISALMSSASGPASIAGVARLVSRNLPLVLFVASLGFLLWPKSADGIGAGEVDETGAAFGDDAVVQPAPTNGVAASGDFHVAA